jgi:hypothetical protein
VPQGNRTMLDSIPRAETTIVSHPRRGPGKASVVGQLSRIADIPIGADPITLCHGRGVHHVSFPATRLRRPRAKWP